LVVSVSSAFGEPVQGGVVTFTAPSSGASTAPAVKMATIGAKDQARVSVIADDVAGSYTVSATTRGATGTASFNLTNRPPSAASLLIPATAGPSQSVMTEDIEACLNVVVEALRKCDLPAAEVISSSSDGPDRGAPRLVGREPLQVGTKAIPWEKAPGILKSWRKDTGSPSSIQKFSSRPSTQNLRKFVTLASPPGIRCCSASP
jgi:hypothetical protein